MRDAAANGPVLRAHRRLARALCAAVFSPAFFGAAPARADSLPSYELQVLRRGQAKRCTEADALGQEVAARVGADPFTSAAPRRFTVVISSTDDAPAPGAPAATIKAEIWFRDAAGHETGPSEVTSSDCAELTTTVAERLAIVIGPVPTRAPPPPPAASARPRRASRLRTAAGIVGSAGAAPVPAFGVSAELGYRHGLGAIGFEGRADVPAEGHTSTTGVDVRSSLIVGSLVPCVLPSVLRVCALATLGSMRKTLTGVERPSPAASFYAAIGARAGVEVRFLERFALEPHVDLLGTVVGTKLCSAAGCATSASVFWRSPPVSGVLGISIASDL